MLRKLALPLALFTGLVTTAAGRAEDVAIVAGIGNYVHLPDAHLDGIDNDVDSMEATLKTSGFQTIRLLDAQASEEGIRQAFAEAARRVHSGDRFVYYQSSHGSRDYHILTYDTTTDGEHMLSKADMQSLMAQVTTKRKSLILDSCFSGGFKERGAGFRQVKFYPIRTLKDVVRQTIRDRTDTVVRTLAPATAEGEGRRDFVIFASSQDNQTSQVSRIAGVPCSVFTHYLTAQLNANRRVAWNSVVQTTISDVVHETDGQQTPVFDSAFLPYLVYTTDQAAEGAGNTATVPVHNLGQLYDINNVDPDRLALSADLDGARPDTGELYHPDTRVRLHLRVNTPGYLFLINRDDSDMAQIVGWGTEDLSIASPDKMVDQSYVSRADDFEMGKGTLKITTSRRQGIENWKAFLFTSREDALKFANLWNELTTNNDKKVRINSFINAKLNTVTRISVSSLDASKALYTSEVHYRVTDQ